MKNLEKFNWGKINMDYLNQILEGKCEPNEIIDKLFQEKKWDILINSLIQR